MEYSFSQFLINESLRRPDLVLGATFLVLTLLVTTLLMVRSNRAKAKSVAAFQLNGQGPYLGDANMPHQMFSSAIPKRTGISASQTHMNELLDIEEALLALRELHHRKLIPAEVYVEESLKQSTRLKG
jgi:hypothetical protein